MVCVRDDRNVWYPRQPPRGAEHADTNGCVAVIALAALCAASFWFGMWLGSRQPLAETPAVEVAK